MTRRAAITDHLARHPGLTAREAATAVGCSVSWARRVLRALYLERGQSWSARRVTRDTDGRAYRYGRRAPMVPASEVWADDGFLGDGFFASLMEAA